MYFDGLEHVALPRPVSFNPLSHGPYSRLKGSLRLLSEYLFGFAVIGESDFDFVARIQMDNISLRFHGLRNDDGHVIDCAGNIRPDIKNLIPGGRHVHTPGDGGSNVVYVRERTDLRPIAK